MRRKTAGVTLLEVLLVMVIASSILLMVIGYMQTRTDEIRRNRAALQMQQILNAGLAYYVANGTWPTTMTQLTTSGRYLPESGVINPWGKVYNLTSTTAPGMLYVYTDVINSANAQIVAGRLPLSYVAPVAPSAGSPPSAGTCAASSTSCYTVASVNVPGQNLNNATGVTFAGLFHSGACVPVPTCPVDTGGTTMTPKIYVVPASVSGGNDNPNCTNSWVSSSGCNPLNVYPISSYTAWATAATNYAGGTNGPPRCDDNTTPARCIYNSGSATMPTGISYWRVCLSITTEKGLVTPTVPAWGQMTGTVLVITRCMPSYETGSKYPDFNVWGP